MATRACVVGEASREGELGRWDKSSSFEYAGGYLRDACICDRPQAGSGEEVGKESRRSSPQKPNTSTVELAKQALRCFCVINFGATDFEVLKSLYLVP